MTAPRDEDDRLRAQLFAAAKAERVPDATRARLVARAVGELDVAVAADAPPWTPRALPVRALATVLVVAGAAAVWFGLVRQRDIAATDAALARERRAVLEEASQVSAALARRAGVSRAAPASAGDPLIAADAGPPRPRCDCVPGDPLCSCIP